MAYVSDNPNFTDKSENGVSKLGDIEGISRKFSYRYKKDI